MYGTRPFPLPWIEVRLTCRTGWRAYIGRNAGRLGRGSVRRSCRAHPADHIHRATAHPCRLVPVVRRSLHGCSSHADRSDGIKTMYQHDSVDRETDLNSPHGCSSSVSISDKSDIFAARAMRKLPLATSLRSSFVSIATTCSANVAIAANVDGLSYRGRCRRQGALTGEPQPQAFLPPDWLSSDALLLSPAGERGGAFNSLFTPRIALPRCFQGPYSRRI